MPKNKMSDLRDHLFETLEDLRDAEDLDKAIERAKAICNVAQTVINTAKVEVEMVNALSGAVDPSQFFEQKPDRLLLEAAEAERAKAPGRKPRRVIDWTGIGDGSYRKVVG